MFYDQGEIVSRLLFKYVIIDLKTRFPNELGSFVVGMYRITTTNLHNIPADNKSL